MGTHLEKVDIFLRRDKDTKHCVHARVSYFTLPDIEYVGYFLTRNNIKPQPQKVSAILALKEPVSVKHIKVSWV